jgi:hypothetical protein
MPSNCGSVSLVGRLATAFATTYFWKWAQWVQSVFRSIPRSAPISLSEISFENLPDFRKALQYCNAACWVSGQSCRVPSLLTVARKLSIVILVDATIKLSTAKLSPLYKLWMIKPKSFLWIAFRPTLRRGQSVDRGPKIKTLCETGVCSVVPLVCPC